MHLLNSEEVVVSGQLGKRLDLAARFLIGTRHSRELFRLPTYTVPFSDEFLLHNFDVPSGRYRPVEEYVGDVLGSWLDFLSMYAKYSGKYNERLEQVVDKLLTYQKSTGEFGENLARPLIWGNQRLLLGLLEYYDFSKDQKVLDAAQQLANFFIDYKQMHESSDSYWTASIQGLVKIWRITNDEKYINFARKIAAHIQSDMDGTETTCHLCALIGMVELYSVTNDKSYLDECIRHWRWIIDKGGLSPTGGIDIDFGSRAQEEGCAGPDWIRFNLALWRVTGDSKYLDYAERALFNSVYAHQLSCGGFGNYVFNGEDGSLFTGFAYHKSCNWECCCYQAPKAFYEIARHIYTTNGNDVWVNFFFPSKVKMRMGESLIILTQETDYPSSGEIRLTIETRQESNFTLHIRVPYWADSLQCIGIEGGKTEEGYMSFSKSWDGHTEIKLSLPMQVRLEKALGCLNKIDLSPLKSEEIIGNAAILYGPLVLGIDAVFDTEALALLRSDDKSQLLIDGTQPDLLKRDSMQMEEQDNPFNIPEAHFRVLVTNSLQPDKKETRWCVAHLSPIAEQTGYQQARAFRYMYPICIVRNPNIAAKLDEIVSSQRLYCEAIRGLDKMQLGILDW